MRRRFLIVPAALLAILFLPKPAGAQTLKIASLRVFPSDVVGPWVSYKARSRSGRSAIREFTQRVAIVGSEKFGDSRGYWVELKTTDRTGSRIERGLFAKEPGEDSEGIDPGAPTDSAAELAITMRPLKLVRYQMLAPGGKLYEYPISSAISPRAGGGISTYELFEFDPTVRPIRKFLGPDTLHIGRRVVPAVVEWSVRTGTDDWQVIEDSASAYRLVLTQTLWRNAAVPITGFARSLFRVTTKKVPAPAPNARAGLFPSDSTMTFAGADTTIGPTSMNPGDGHLLSWTELVIQDLGSDAVAEVTQKAEPAPITEQKVPADLLR